MPGSMRVSAIPRTSIAPALRGGAFIGLLLLTGSAHAQIHRATDPVATPASSLVLQDDALAIDVNPAALGQLPDWSIAVLHSQVDQHSWLGRGDALYLATPVFGPLAVGADRAEHSPRRPGATPARVRPMPTARWRRSGSRSRRATRSA